MKTIIYAGIGLFTAASVYGIADYYSSEKKGKLKNLYKDVPAASKENVSKAPDPDIKLEDYSRAKLEEVAAKEKTATVANISKVIEKDNAATIKKKFVKRKSPKIKFSDFSRSKLVREKPLVPTTDSSTGKY